MLDRENTITGHVDSIGHCVPIGVLFVDVHKRWLVRWWRIGKGVCSVYFDNKVTFFGAYGKEETHDRLFDAGQISVCKFQLGCCARRSVTTVAGLSRSIGHDQVVPVLAKNDGTGGWMDQGTVYSLLCQGIKLLQFCLEPFIPVGDSLKLAPSESAETLFFRGFKHSSIKRTHHDEDLIVR